VTEKELELTANPSLPAADDDASAPLAASVTVSLPDHEIPTASPLPLMQLSIGFWSFKALATAYELDLFTHLAGTGGRTVEELAETLGIEQRPAELLITACASVGLLQRRDGRYVNSALADEFLVRGKPYHFGGWVQMLDRRLYPAWGRLAEAVRANRPTSWNPDEQAHLFDGEDPLMLAPVLGGDAFAVDNYRPRTRRPRRPVGFHRPARHRRRLRGLRHRAVPAQPQPAGNGVRPAAGLRDRLEEGRGSRLRDRIAVAPGDFLADAELPAGHDVVLLSMILHDWTPEQDLAILHKCLPHSLPAVGS
jgi:hypothetical protein